MTLQLVVPTLILLAGIVNDLKSKKIRNALVIVLALVSVMNAYYFGGHEGLTFGFLSLLIAFGSCLPLVLSGVLGAGDMKLLMAFALSVSPMSTFLVLLYSFFWGALLGLLRALLNKEGLQLLINTFDIAKGGKKAVAAENLHKIPYTVALFFGWLTQLTLTGFRG